MPNPLPAGPYRTVSLPTGGSAPFYVIPFDKRGVCEAPQTRAQLLADAAKDGVSDIFLYSHGWNNDWTIATTRYEQFLKGFMEMRQQFHLTPPRGYQPLLVGIFWPSTALTFGEGEEGPAMAATDDAAVGRARHDISELGAALSAKDAERFYELAARETVDETEAREMTAMFLPLASATTDDVPGPALEADAFIEAAAPQDEAAISLDDFGTVGAGATEADTAGVLDKIKKLDPRQLVRAFTVWQMKDRAAIVGAEGVGPLLRDLLKRSARVHLIGHSFGAKVMMAAAAAGPLPRNISSALLLQPAMSHLCFADQVPGSGGPGGYRQVLGRVDGRILCTFSKHDVPLTKGFHLALRRKQDLGEPQIAANEPPSVYAALGGFGPRRAGEALLPIQDPDDQYKWPASKVIGLNGDRTIGGHGEVSNPSTWWALYCGAFLQ